MRKPLKLVRTGTGTPTYTGNKIHQTQTPLWSRLATRKCASSSNNNIIVQNGALQMPGVKIGSRGEQHCVSIIPFCGINTTMPTQWE